MRSRSPAMRSATGYAPVAAAAGEALEGVDVALDVAAIDRGSEVGGLTVATVPGVGERPAHRLLVEALRLLAGGEPRLVAVGHPEP